MGKREREKESTHVPAGCQVSSQSIPLNGIRKLTSWRKKIKSNVATREVIRPVCTVSRIIRSIMRSELLKPVLCFLRYQTKIEVIRRSPTLSAASQIMTTALKCRKSTKLGTVPVSYAVTIPATPPEIAQMKTRPTHSQLCVRTRIRQAKKSCTTQAMIPVKAGSDTFEKNQIMTM